MLPQYTSLLGRRVVAAIAVLAISHVRAEEEKKPETSVAVSVAKIVRTTLHGYVTAYGVVEGAPVTGPNQPAGGAKLAPGIAGLVTSVNAAEGARVEKGAVIVQLDSRAADAAVQRAQAAATAAEKARARQVQMQAAEGTSERALQEAEAQLAAAKADLAAAQQMQSLLAVRAPIAGTIARLQVRPGEWLDVGKEVGEIVDPDRLVISTQVPAAEAAGLQANQEASVYARSSDEKPVAQATVQFVSPQVTPGSDAVLVRLTLPKASGVRAGQLVAARITTETHADRLAVPREAVYTDPDGHSTLSIVEGDMARQKVVQTGLRDGALIEVSGEGVSEGATVVTVGSYALPKETKVRVLTTKEGGK